jgi:hypothetical protein
MTEPAQTPVDAPAPPSTPAEAATRLDQLKQDPAWRDGFLKGGPAQMREYGDLQALVAKGDDVDAAMSGVLPDFADADLKQMAGTAEMLKSMGFPPTSIRETLSSKEAIQADVDRATAWKNENLNSKDFVDRLMRGEPDAARQLMVANIILSSPLKTEGNA